MVLKYFSYTDGKKKKSIKVELCDTFWKKFCGLMFRKNSPPLLFPFSKETNLSIHSLFCKPFTAIWLDEKKRVTKKKFIDYIGLDFSGRGKYLIEIPQRKK